MALTKVYKIEIDGQEAAATVRQIEQEVERMEEGLKDLVPGSAAADKAIREIGKAKGVLKELDDAIDALNPKERAAAFVDFANGVVGGFGIATVAAENFGLASKGSAEEVEKKMLQLMTVMQSVEAIHKAMNSETQSVLKNMLSSAKSYTAGVLGIGESWTVAGVKARFFGTATKAALTAAGIGILIVVLATVITQWDKITAGVGRFKDYVSNTFPGIGKAIDWLGDKLRNIASFVTFGLIDDAATAAVKKVEEADKRVRQAQHDLRARLIAEEEAAGKDVFEMKKRQLEDEIRLLDKSAEDYKKQLADKQSAIRVLEIQHAEKLKAESVAAEKSRYQSMVAEIEARGKDAYAVKRRLLQYELTLLKEGTAEYAAKQSEIRQLTIKHNQELAKLAEDEFNKQREKREKATEKELAAREGVRNKRLAIARAQGANEERLLKVEIENQRDIQQQLLEQGQKNTAAWYESIAAIREKEARLVDISIEKQREETRKRKAELDQQQSDKEQQVADLETRMNKDLLQMQANGATEAQIQVKKLFWYREILSTMEKLGLTGKQAFNEIKVAILGLEKVTKDDSTIWDKLFKNLFGHLKGEDQEIVRQSLQALYSSVMYMWDSMLSDSALRLDAQLETIDARLDVLQERREETEDALKETQDRINDLEEQADKAKGARREALISKITRERQEEARLTAEKKKTAAEEAKLAKQREEVEQKRQALEARSRIAQEASIAITQASTAAEAISAGVRAVSGANTIPFPGNLAAIAAAVAATGAAIMSAKKLAGTISESRLANGGPLDGPSHLHGGIPIPGTDIEVEGGEYVTKRTAYQNNQEAVEKINRLGASMRFVAVPADQVRRMAQGGALPENGGSSTAAAQSQEPEASSLSGSGLGAITALLENIAATNAEIAAKDLNLAIGDDEAFQITERSDRRKRDMNAGKLFS